MGLTRYRLGELIQPCTGGNENLDYGPEAVRGISVNKEFIETKADLRGVNLAGYTVVRPNCFSFVTVTSRNGGKISIAYNDSNESFLVSSFYVTFCLSDTGKAVLDEKYLFMLVNRSEFDRYARSDSWGSAREYFYYENMADVCVSLPPIEVQRKYVAVYEAMLANQRAYEQGLDDLKLTCDALIEKLMRELPHEEIGPYIEQCDARNSDGAYGPESVRGLSIAKQLIETKANLDGVSLTNYKLVAPGSLTYVPVTSRNGNKISIALNESNETYITSAINTVLHVKAEASDRLLPGYLMLFFNRSEFDRLARFCSWGSARETFDWGEMCDVRIPLPDLSVQRYAVELYQAWRTRIAVNDRLKAQIKDICPVLIRGSVEEAAR